MNATAFIQKLYPFISFSLDTASNRGWGEEKQEKEEKEGEEENHGQGQGQQGQSGTQPSSSPDQKKSE